MKKKLLIILSIISLMSCGIKNDTKTGNRLVVAENKYYVYYDNEVIELNKDTYITKDMKIGDYFFNFKFLGIQLKDERKLLLDLAKYFPHGINEIQKGNSPEKFVTIPTYMLNNKSIIDSVKLADLLSGESLINSESNSELIEAKEATSDDVSLENKKVEILNANGIAGYAKKLGETLKSNLKMEYNAENYNKSSNVSYIINHKLNDKQLETFIENLGIKYIKILNDQSIKPDADVVVITGNDKLVDFTVTIETNNEKTELKNLLNGYKLVFKNNSNVADGIVIKYNKEDEFIAKNIAKILSDAKLQQDDTIKNGLLIQSSR